ncbi:hypothetical protein FF124_18165 [Martelella lutilitoris]|uniref:Uncharacterized protein n=1 Tax=Martelella lutilitoris TaxID=2583532 RepID=A0A5C4JMS9_9HYPH|nr:hypothetical protein [Martelella lutilitoris]TNB46444.1 hypothetical protein FF124_18165 [Martelella lutilitoris]
MTIKLRCLVDQLFVHDHAKVVGGPDHPANALFAFIDQFHEFLAARAAEDFIGNADLRRTVELLKPPDNLGKQRGRVLQLLSQGVGIIAKPPEGFRCRSALALREDEFIGAKVHLLQPVRKGADADTVALGNKLQFLKRANIDTGNLRLIADFGNAARNVANFRDNGGQPADCQAADNAARKGFAECADLRRRACQRLVHRRGRAVHIVLHVPGCRPGRTAHAVIVPVSRPAGLRHVLFKVANSRFDQNKQALFVARHQNHPISSSKVSLS